MKPRKSWREKLADSKGLPKIGKVMGKMTTRLGTGKMVVPAPIEVDAMMKQVPKGKLTTINEIRAALARKHNVTIGCPITTGIFAWIAAHAAEESAAAGAKRVTPYWRTLKTGGQLNEKYRAAFRNCSSASKSKATKSSKKASATSWRNLENRCSRRPSQFNENMAEQRSRT